MNIVLVVGMLIGIATVAESSFSYCPIPEPYLNLVVFCHGRLLPGSVRQVPVGAKCRFYCKKGYAMLLRRRYKYMVCYDYGWTGRFPKCIERVGCGRRTAPTNGYVSPNNVRLYKPDAVIQFSCRKGFRLEGEEKDKCGKNGEWIVNETPTCPKIKCPARMAPENGFVNPEKPEYSYKEEITFSCQTEPKLYILVGKEKDRCGYDDKWLINQTPTCKITCPGRTAPENGKVKPSRRFFFEDDEVEFECNDGYRLDGEEKDTCQGDGNWEIDDTPTCVLITCSQRMAPENGRIIGQENPNVPDTRIKFECLPGYRLDGIEKDVCLEDGTWREDDDPVCVLITCAQRDAPENGVIEGSKDPYTPSDGIKFVCDEGYRLQGTETDTCLEEGDWEVNETPLCVLITCSQRDAPENGRIEEEQDPYTPTDVIRFICDDGYRLDGEDTDTCLDSGEWELDETPSCILITCSQRGAPENGGITGTKNPYTPTDEITFTCDDGYDLVGTAEDTCTEDGTWEINDTPQCELITCPQRDAPVNGGILGMQDPYTPNDEISFECGTGYRLEGTKDDVCQDDGTWEVNETPTCVLITCTQRDPPEAGRIVKTKNPYVPNDVIEFECADYYRLVGEEKDTCQDDGTWEVNETPECQLILCEELDLPENGYYDVFPLPGRQPFQPGTKLRYACNNHYEIEGYPFNKCDKDGKWTSKNDPPTCVPVVYTCDPIINPPRYGYMEGKKSEYAVGDKVTFSCGKNFQINDITYDECLEHGVWKYADDYDNPRYPECRKRGLAYD